MSFYTLGQKVAFIKLGADPDAGLKYLAMKHAPGGEGAYLTRPISKLWGGPGSSLTEAEQAMLKKLIAAQQGATTPEEAPAAVAQTLHAAPDRGAYSQYAAPDEATMLEDVKRHIGR